MLFRSKAETLISGKEAFLSVAKWLEKLSGANVKEVVYCEDCKHGQCQRRIGVICEYDQTAIVPYKHFCGWGEMIEQGGKDDGSHDAEL
mgnify:FL=1